MRMKRTGICMDLADPVYELSENLRLFTAFVLVSWAMKYMALSQIKLIIVNMQSVRLPFISSSVCCGTTRLTFISVLCGT